MGINVFQRTKFKFWLVWLEMANEGCSFHKLWGHVLVWWRLRWRWFLRGCSPHVEGYTMMVMATWTPNKKRQQQPFGWNFTGLPAAIGLSDDHILGHVLLNSTSCTFCWWWHGLIHVESTSVVVDGKRVAAVLGKLVVGICWWGEDESIGGGDVRR